MEMLASLFKSQGSLLELETMAWWIKATEQKQTNKQTKKQKQHSPPEVKKENSRWEIMAIEASSAAEFSRFVLIFSLHPM